MYLIPVSTFETRAFYSLFFAVIVVNNIRLYFTLQNLECIR